MSIDAVISAVRDRVRADTLTVTMTVVPGLEDLQWRPIVWSDEAQTRHIVFEELVGVWAGVPVRVGAPLNGETPTDTFEANLMLKCCEGDHFFEGVATRFSTPTEALYLLENNALDTYAEAKDKICPLCAQHLLHQAGGGPAPAVSYSRSATGKHPW